MLSEADAELCLREPGIPALALALDPGAVTAALQAAFPTLDVRSASAEYVRYKPGANALVAWNVATGHGPEWITVKAFDDMPGRARALATVQPRYAAVLWDGAGLATRLPVDARLPGLCRLLSDAGPLVDLRVLQYRPERRLVARARRGATEVVAKAHSSAAFASVSARSAPLAVPGVRIQASVALLPDLAVVVHEWLPGEPLDRLRGEAALLGAEGAGRALAALHEAGAPADWPMRSDPEDAITAAGRAAVAVHPQLGGLVDGLVARLLAAKPATPALNAVHGDFGAKQVIIGEEPGFIDFDEAHAGHPAEDVASFLAHSFRDGLRDRDTDRSMACDGAFLAGYVAGGGAGVSPVLYWELSVALLRLAVEPFRYRWNEWPQAVHLIVEQARELADGL